MRILWFTNTPSLAARENDLNINKGGWISTLEMHILSMTSIQLAIAFPGNKPELTSFTRGRTLYYAFPASDDDGIFRGLLKRWRHSIESKRELSYFLSVIEQFKPDLIHVFGSEKQYGLISSYSVVPVILQVQGNLTACLQKWFSGISFFQVLKYCNKKNFLLGYGIFHQYFLLKKRSVRELKILANSKFIIGRTEWDRRIMKVQAPNCTYFHCEELIRDEFFSKLWNYRSNQKIVVLSILSPIIYKGLESVLKTASILAGIEDFRFEWQIAGVRGNEEIIRIIEKASGMAFHDQKVIFKGMLTASELADSLVNSFCYVHPSHIENSANSICEAMTTGVPVIATYAGGTPSMVRDGVEGTLVQDGDPYAMAGAILELVNSPQQMKAYSQQSRETALIRHNPEVVVRDLIGIYHKVLTSN